MLLNGNKENMNQASLFNPSFCHFSTLDRDHRSSTFFVFDQRIPCSWSKGFALSWCNAGKGKSDYPITKR
jgi:hypothetical protein